MALTDTDKLILDEVADGAKYLYQSLVLPNRQSGTGPHFTSEQAGKIVTHAVPELLKARLGALRRL